MPVAILATTSTVNFAGDWTSVDTALNSALGASLVTFLGVLGTILIIFSVIKYVWDRRRTGQGNHTHVMWTLLIGAILAVPAVVMPAILTILDAIVNVFLKILP
ncbi:MAG: hypothetical protein M0Z42_18855 [Actinomycetota bacterium]|jgi:hypothetical protein|nr:hypothetical protein [Actinomycetota bacterium]